MVWVQWRPSSVHPSCHERHLKLFVGVSRYYVASDWTPKKLNVEVQMPDTLDLESLRARGPQPGEQLQPEGPTGESLKTAVFTVIRADGTGKPAANIIAVPVFDLDMQYLHGIRLT